ncbi:hypothetical protein GCM10009093_14350 [Brevundimonas terrae]|uniref:Uncharacterized protein n=1 Tax=Brevundimonas terrae TaxID=363631 RepID=A0ABP3I2Q6_9CAUL
MSPHAVALTRPVVAVFRMGMGDQVSALWLNVQSIPLGTEWAGFNANRQAGAGRRGWARRRQALGALAPVVVP